MRFPAKSCDKRMTAVARRVELEGAFNLRDLGGYRTASGRRIRWRRLFRSDSLHRLTGPDLDGLSRLALRTQRPVVASGGIATAEDVAAVASLGPHVQGVVLGRALYDGGLTVRDAVRVAAESGL